MAAYYDFLENPNPKGDGEQQPLHPRIVVKETIKTDRIVEDIAFSASITQGDMAAALSALEERLSHYLSNGYNVELGNIGYFSATLKARPVMEKSEIRSMSVSFDSINFRPTAKFRKSLKGELRRAPYGFRKSKNQPVEERKELVINHLEKYPFITRKEYSLLTGRLKTLALKDLNEWVEERFLKAYGNGNRKVYMKGESL